MLLAGNTDLANALEASTRSYQVRVEADWNGDGLYSHSHSDLSTAVEDLDFERFAGNDLPEEVTLVQGHQVGSLRVQLSGEVAGTPVIELFSTFRSTGPFAGQDLIGTRMKFTVSVDTAVGSVDVPQFTGVLRAIEIDSGGRAVDIEVLDLAAAMYAPIDLPATEMHISQVEGPFNGHTNTQSVVDHVLRRNGIYTSPGPPSGAIISAPGHGGFAADVGYGGCVFSANATNTAEWEDSVWPGLLATPIANWGATANDTNFIPYVGTKPIDLVTVGRGFALASWINIGGSIPGSTTANRYLYQVYPTVYKAAGTNAHNQYAFNIHLSGDGLLTVQWVKTMSGTQTSGTVLTRQLSGAMSWRYLGFYFKRETATSLRVTIRVDGSNTSATYDPGSMPDPGTAGQVTASMYCSWSNLYGWLVDDLPTTWPGEDTSFVSEADVPVGRAYMTYLPDQENVNSLDILSSAVGAEYGRFGFNEEGRFQYRPKDITEGDVSSLDRTVTSDKPLEDLASEQFLDSVRNNITAATRGRGYQDHPYHRNYMFEASHVKQFVCPPGFTRFPITLSERVGRFASTTPAATIIPSRTVSDWNKESQWGVSGFVAVQDGSPSTVQSTGVTALFEVTGHRTGLVTVNNTSTVTVRFQTPPPDDEPAFRIASTSQQAKPEKAFETLDQPSIDKYGRRSFGIAPSEWRSAHGPYVDMTGELLVNLRKPVTTLKRVPMLGDPRDQIGDLHLVKDPDGLGEVYGLVQGIYRSYSKSQGLKQSVQYRVQQAHTANSYVGMPAGTDITATAGPGSYTLAHEFRVTSTSWLTQMWFHRTSTAVNPSQIRVYKASSSASGTPLAGTFFSVNQASGTGWKPLTLPEPVLLEVDVPYYACFLYVNSEWPNLANYWSSGGAGYDGHTNGPLWLPGRLDSINGQANFISGTTMQFPTQYSTAAENRGIDVTVVDNPYA